MPQKNLSISISLYLGTNEKLLNQIDEAWKAAGFEKRNPWIIKAIQSALLSQAK